MNDAIICKQIDITVKFKRRKKITLTLILKQAIEYLLGYGCFFETINWEILANIEKMESCIVEHVLKQKKNK